MDRNLTIEIKHQGFHVDTSLTYAEVKLFEFLAKWKNDLTDRVPNFTVLFELKI